MSVSRRKLILVAAIAGLSQAFMPGRRARAGGAKAGFTTDGEKVAIQGYDTVAYFTEGKAIQGSAEFETKWMDARWRFSSAEHRDLFTERPDAYAPRFGGYCVMGMTLGAMAPPDPKAWTIVDGKLYLAGTYQDVANFRRDPANYIRMAEKRWDALEH